jgi:hypothetical protein
MTFEQSTALNPTEGKEGGFGAGKEGGQQKKNSEQDQMKGDVHGVFLR